MLVMSPQVLGDLLRVRAQVWQHAAKQCNDERRTQEYLYAAARGDTSQIQQVQLSVIFVILLRLVS